VSSCQQKLLVSLSLDTEFKVCSSSDFEQWVSWSILLKWIVLPIQQYSSRSIRRLFLIYKPKKLAFKMLNVVLRDYSHLNNLQLFLIFSERTMKAIRWHYSPVTIRGSKSKQTKKVVPYRYIIVTGMGVRRSNFRRSKQELESFYDQEIE
jgi:hypothetical protein